MPVLFCLDIYEGIKQIINCGDDYVSDKNVEQNLQLLTHCQIYIKVFVQFDKIQIKNPWIIFFKINVLPLSPDNIVVIVKLIGYIFIP